jgi:hypothetical protein
MKTIRFIAGILLIISGVLHVILYIKTSDNPGTIGLLGFGIIYAAIGVLLFNTQVYPVYLGLIVPLIGMILSMIRFGVPELISLLMLFKVIGVTVIALCAWILLKNQKPFKQ